MPRSAGTYSLPANAHGVPGNIINSTYYNNVLDDLGNEITNSLPRDGTAAMTGPVKAADGALAAPGVTFGSDTDTGLYRYTSNEIGIAAGGTYIGRITPYGVNLGDYTALASSATTDLSTIASQGVSISGTTTITSFGTAPAGIVKDVVFTGALTLTYNATSMILPGVGDITTAAGDTCRVRSLGSGNWRVTEYTRAAAAVPVLLSTTVPTASSHADITASVPTVAKLVVSNVSVGSSGADLWFQVSNDAGVSFVASGYQHQRLQAATSATSTAAAAGSASDTKIILCNALNTAAAVSGEIICDTTAKMLTWRLGYFASSGNLVVTTGSASMASTSGVNAYRFAPSTGNLAAGGSIKMYNATPS